MTSEKKHVIRKNNLHMYVAFSEHAGQKEKQNFVFFMITFTDLK